MLSTALTIAFLFAVSDAAQVNKIRSSAFLSAGVSVDAQQKTHTTSSTQLSLLQKIQSQMYSDIDEAQNVLNVALVELEHSVPKEALNTTNTTIAHSKEKGTTEMHKDPSKPIKNTTSNAVAPVGSKEARVRQVAQTQQALLENLFKHLKSNIVNLNKQEVTSKETAAKNIQRLQTRLTKDKADLQKKDLSKFEHDRLVNRTRTDTFELQYWTRDRSLGHQMFHTNLKMEHGLMSRVHQVIAACKDAVLKGHIDPQLMKKVQAQAVPKAFVEMRSNLKHKAQQYYAHVLTARWEAAEEPEE